MKKALRVILASLLLVNVYIASWLALHGDIQFWPDNARDMLLLEGMTTEKLITFIGPRSGGIPGVFHGPLWLYLNLPAYVLGGGNPAVLGLFWCLLFIGAMIILWNVTAKLFNTDTALLTTTLFSFIFRTNVASMFNPFGAVMMFPIFVLWFYKYLETNKWKYLLLSYFVLGIIIQFQMAFGVPLLVLAFIYTLIVTYRRGNLRHLAALLVILLPLVTFVVFEFRHDFLQAKAVIRHFSSSGGGITISHIAQRMRSMVTEGTGASDWWIVGIFWIVILSRLKEEIVKKKSSVFVLSMYFYIGYWLVTLFYRGQMWVFYYWPLIPVFLMLVSAHINSIKKPIAHVALAIIVITFVQGQLNWFKEYKKPFIGTSSVSWKFYENSVAKIYTDAKGDFGYYIFSDDELGYQPRYVFHYLQKKHVSKKAASNTKKRETYVFIFPVKYSFLDKEWWMKNRVKISGKPVSTTKYENGIVVEKYLLSPEEIAIPSDPNLIDSMIFR